MKKIFLIITITLTFGTILNAQLNYNFGFSFSSYVPVNEEAAYLRPSIEPNLGISYYFSKKIGITTNLFFQKRYIDIDAKRILSDNFQIPIMITMTKKRDDFPIGLSTSFGYALTIPTKGKIVGGSNYDIGLIHGVYGNYSLDAWLNENMKFYISFGGGLDLQNKNNIKFIKGGILLGINVKLSN